MRYRKPRKRSCMDFMDVMDLPENFVAVYKISQKKTGDWYINRFEEDVYDTIVGRKWNAKEVVGQKFETFEEAVINARLSGIDIYLVPTECFDYYDEEWFTFDSITETELFVGAMSLIKV